jgi:predicted protein tyrosine phosphatase
VTITELNLDLAVASCEGAESLIHHEPNRWAVISIRGKHERKAQLRCAKAAVEVVFDDIIRESDDLILPSQAHIQRVLDALVKFAGDPLLVHCAYGASRSPAVALGAIYRSAKVKQVPNAADFSLRWLLRITDGRQICPNPRVASLLVKAIDHGKRNPFAKFMQHPLWPRRPEDDFYSRFFPKRLQEGQQTANDQSQP